MIKPDDGQYRQKHVVLLSKSTFIRHKQLCHRLHTQLLVHTASLAEILVYSPTFQYCADDFYRCKTRELHPIDVIVCRAPAIRNQLHVPRGVKQRHTR